MSIQQDVLAAAQRLCRERGEWTFSPDEIVRALPGLNPSSVRTHIVSRCCVNAPANHAHRLEYFRRVGRAVYEVMPRYRRGAARRAERGQPSRAAGRQPRNKGPAGGLRDTVHAFITKDGEWYVADCAEIAVVTQGRTIDETVANLREGVALHLEGEEATTLGIVPAPRLVLTIEVRAGHAAA